MVRARGALAEADVLIASKHMSGAVNRLYYAAFYAARALLATHNLDSARHSGIISLFQEHFVRNGLIAGEVARVLPRAFEKRQTSDYDDFMEPSEDEVSSLRSQIERFVACCDAFLTKAP
jgi:uncharacterized protein (UPF0332 family)